MDAVDKAVQARVARVFLSYKRHVEPDQTLAGELVRGLEQAGCTVFIDQRLTVGQAWAQEIERQVREADYLVVFLTADSSRSEMVRGEIEMARHYAAVASRPRILPVRVNFDGSLPYPLNAYLDKIQYATWNAPEDTPRLLEELARRDGRAARDRDARRTCDGGRQPASSAALRRAAAGAGRHARRRRSVVSASARRTPRPCPTASQPGQTLTIKGPRQMGKSSLLMRTVKAGLDHGKRVALLDFQLVDETTKADADAVLPPLRVVDCRAARAARHRRRAVGYRVLEPAELHAIRGAAHPPTAQRSVHDRDRRDRLDLPHDVFGGLLRDAAELARTARASGAARLEERSTSSSRRPPSRSSSSTVRTSRPSTSASCCRSRISCRSRSHSSTRSIRRPLGDARRPAAVRARRRPSVPDAQGALHGREQHADVRASTTLFAHATDDTGPVRRSSALLPAAAAAQARADRDAPAGDRAAGGTAATSCSIHRLQAAGLVRREGNKVVPRCDLVREVFQRAPA